MRPRTCSRSSCAPARRSDSGEAGAGAAAGDRVLVGASGGCSAALRCRGRARASSTRRWRAAQRRFDRFDHHDSKLRGPHGCSEAGGRRHLVVSTHRRARETRVATTGPCRSRTTPTVSALRARAMRSANASCGATRRLVVRSISSSARQAGVRLHARVRKCRPAHGFVQLAAKMIVGLRDLASHVRWASTLPSR